MCGGLFSFCFLHETVFGNGNVAITHNVIWLYAGGAKQHKTFTLHKRLLKARKLGLNANPHLRKTNVSGSFYYGKV
jgi:hypothetical protein